MFPGTLSLLPVTVAVVTFIGEKGFGGVYPFWYLGVPLRYLTGPIYPLAAFGLRHILPTLSWFEVVLLLTGISLVLGVLGMGVWVNHLLLYLLLAGRFWRLVGVGVGILFFVINPFVWFWGWGLAEGSLGFGVLLLPWVWLAFWWCFRQPKSYINMLLGSILVAFVVLINTSLYIDVLVAVLAGAMFSGVDRRGRGKLLFRGFSWLIGGFGLASLWYGVDYWGQSLFLPSIGGQSFGKMLVGLFNWLLQVVPVVLVLVVLFRRRLRLGTVGLWLLAWVGTFGLLTVWRFLADPDFWMDWSRWGVEIGMGVAVGVAVWLVPFRLGRWRVLLVGGLLLGYLVGWGVIWRYRDWWMPRGSVSGSVEARVSEMVGREYELCLSEREHCGRVFVSGVGTFWLNALYPHVPQVRGGREAGVVGEDLLDLVFVLRESNDSTAVERALSFLGVEWIVVHERASEDYYSDFTYTEVYRSLSSQSGQHQPVLTLVEERAGDVLYRVREPVFSDWQVDDSRAILFRVGGLLVGVLGVLGFGRWGILLLKKLSFF